MSTLRTLLALSLIVATACPPKPQGKTAPKAKGKTAQGKTAPRPKEKRAPEPKEKRAPKKAAVEARVAELLAAARAQEPAVSTLLKKVAAANAGSLVGFEHRLKTRRSLTRKIRLILSEGGAKTPAKVTINDALRYTLQVPDTPAGRYLSTIKTTLARLSKLGHRVVKLKNYWPRGDNYSGVNSVLITPRKLRWELQFHTPRSYQAQKATRPQYERLRLRATPLHEKRKLFDAMATIWDSVPIPQGALTPGALHPAATIRKLARP